MGQNPLVCRFLRGVFNQRPPPVKVVPTWDIGQVLLKLAECHPPSEIRLLDLTRKVTFLLATCTARRVSDLMLFSVRSPLCYVGDRSVVLQAEFGSKTDRPSHRSPPVKLKLCAEERLCPVRYIKEYLRRTEPLRQGDSLQLLISPFTGRPVKLATVRRWIVQVLQDAGVTASAGSTRATATSCALLHDVPLQQIMASADWSRQDTPLRHYLRVLPERTLRHVADRQVQDAVCGDAVPLMPTDASQS